MSRPVRSHARRTITGPIGQPLTIAVKCGQVLVSQRGRISTVVEMKSMIFGSKGQVACLSCGGTRFVIHDAIVQCRCGEMIGRYLSLCAFANGEAHEGVNAWLTSPSLYKRLLWAVTPSRFYRQDSANRPQVRDS
jgi:hypothetical protein